MNAFIPENPHITIFLDEGGVVTGTTNIHPELKVNIVRTEKEFAEVQKGDPFPVAVDYIESH